MDDERSGGSTDTGRAEPKLGGKAEAMPHSIARAVCNEGWKGTKG
jgi:hypothetical protein